MLFRKGSGREPSGGGRKALSPSLGPTEKEASPPVSLALPKSCDPDSGRAEFQRPVLGIAGHRERRYTGDPEPRIAELRKARMLLKGKERPRLGPKGSLLQSHLRAAPAKPADHETHVEGPVRRPRAHGARAHTSLPTWGGRGQTRRQITFNRRVGAQVRAQMAGAALRRCGLWASRPRARALFTLER